MYGGYFAGVIDTTQGNIIASDASQTGKRYLLICGPYASGGDATTFEGCATNVPSGAQTRWDGLSATIAMVNAQGANAYAASYCNGLSYPSDGGSQWYLPAMDELELLYRNFKPQSFNNTTSGAAWGGFPDTPTTTYPGYNPSSSPQGAAYTTTSPGWTSVSAFQTQGASGGQAFYASGSTTYAYWSSTANSTTAMFAMDMSGTNNAEQNAVSSQNTGYRNRVRPVRRVYY